MTKKSGHTTRQKLVLLRSVFEAVDEIVNNNKILEKVLEKINRENGHWTNGQRRFVSETTRSLIRYRRLLFEALDLPETKEYSLYLYWQLYGVLLLLQGKDPKEFPSLKEFKSYEVTGRLKRFSENLEIRESYPEWFFKEAKKQLGEQWSETAVWLNKPADYFIRINTLKCTKLELVESLKKEGIECYETSLSKDAQKLESAEYVFKSTAFKNGWFEVQDLASQLVSDYLAPKPGSKVIDACSGTGGKTLALAALMKNKGKIIAADIIERKFIELKKRAARAGVQIIETKNANELGIEDNWADYLLIDAPCSGTGVWRRNPDGKWKLTEEKLRELEEIQKNILNTYTRYLKSGGNLVYAVCSILPSEGKKIIEEFLKQNKNMWELEGEKSLLPQYFDTDGFYMALLKKN
ncbi:MAG: RsmB/NOP family class I SAM-dependent RNA methyltransferase [Bacteroidota bacterium]|jgi:16S rRNA (cytosine967-C5)-methyltransferase